MTEQTKAEGLKVDEARERIAGAEGKRPRVADIRSFEVFSEGHIAGALSVDEADTEIERKLEDEDAECWIVVCDDGKRSGEVAAQLAEHGLDVAYLDGGMKAWIKQDLPTQPPESDSEYEGPDTTTLY